MIIFKNRDLIGSPHKTSNKRNLFDFMKYRVNISLCVSEKFVLNHHLSDVFLTN